MPISEKLPPPLVQVHLFWLVLWWRACSSAMNEEAEALGGKDLQSHQHE
jgi:hypothetical protein